jgi:CIC family chloride channel protein
VDLLDIPAKRLQPAAIEMRATVREALDTMRKQGAEGLYVVQTTAPGIRRCYGVVTRADIESQFLT